MTAPFTAPQTAILSALNCGRALHLCELRDNPGCGGYPELQATLAELIRAGLVQHDWDDGSPGWRTRIYQITQTGRQVLNGEPSAQPQFLAWFRRAD